ncbi:MAG TPA: hypothetical protein VGD58_07500 [Herpetosiphonaceae bacterium]
MLHITNGDTTVTRLEVAQIPGQIVAWKDVLHEGPVPAERSLEELREIRARYIAGRGWAAYIDVLADFTQRDAALAGFRAHDEVVLWFEHDLYDQLQLIQLLDWFSGQELGQTSLSLICIGEFAGVEPFHGLGQLTPAQLQGLYPTRQPVTASELRLGKRAWQAFCAPDPTAIERLLSDDTAALPFLAAALRRHLEQFPAVGSGLSRTERQILQMVASGRQQPIPLFLEDQRQEEHVFMGDTVFWSYVDDLCEEPSPLLAPTDGAEFRLPDACRSYDEFAAQTVTLTERGHAVLAASADYLDQHPIDRWLGGVYLQGRSRWRWDRERGRIVSSATE